MTAIKAINSPLSHRFLGLSKVFFAPIGAIKSGAAMLGQGLGVPLTGVNPACQGPKRGGQILHFPVTNVTLRTSEYSKGQLGRAGSACRPATRRETAGGFA